MIVVSAVARVGYILYEGGKDVQQNDLRMRAAFSHSLSKAAGKRASRPWRPALSRFTEDGSLSAQPRTLSILVLLLAAELLLLLRSQLGIRADTRCIVGDSAAGKPALLG